MGLILRYLWVLCAVLAGPAAAQVTVAAAANFATTAEALIADFKARGGDEVTLVLGSTGKIYAQIVSGAPYDVFLSADAARPARLLEDGLVVGGPVTYALGTLVLVRDERLRETGLDAVLTSGERLAIADPAVAPYGLAAQEVLDPLRGGDWRDGLVLGESVGQAFAFVATGNAPAGLVGLAQALERPEGLRITPVPPERHTPIRQDAVLLARAAENEAARAFFDYLGSAEAQVIIAAAGYEAPQ